MNTRRFFFGLLLFVACTARAQFNYVSYNGTAIITGYTGPAGPVVIPSTLGGLPVTQIQGSGFENRGITSVAISDSVTNIQAQEFAPNDFLTTFTVDSNNPAYSSVGGVLFDKNGKLLVEYPPGVSGSFSVPTNVTSIGPSAFAACYSLSGISIPDSVTNIGAEGFGFCFGLTNLTVPASITGIGPGACINCSNLPAITVASGNPFYSSIGGVLFDKNATTLLEFPAGQGGIYSVPNGVDTIGTNAFILCNRVTGFVMQASVANLDDGAFGDCAGLTNVTLGAGVSYISTSVFSGSDQMVAINVDPGNPNFSSLNGVVFNKAQTMLVRFPPGFLGEYTIPASVTSIADYAFEDCSLTDVIIPGNVASVGFDSFQGCGSLTNVTMSNGVSSVGEFAFGDCPKLTIVTIPATIGELPFGVFAYDGLTSVFFEGNEPLTDPDAFLGDTATVFYRAGTGGWGPALDGLTTMMENAPNPNGSLQVTINPTGAVNSGALWQVDGGLLQPSDSTVVGLSVGQHTLSFTAANGWATPGNQIVSVTANSTNTATATYVQADAPASDFLFVTNSASITITGYVGSGGTVKIPASITSLPVTVIAAQAFSGVPSITSVTIPDTVTNLGDYAFSSCASLSAVTVSAGISIIAAGTFMDCFSLNDITFRGSVTSIDDYAFASCPQLETMAISDVLTNLGQYAFFADGLTNISLPASLTNIGEAAFLDCTKLPAIIVDPANPAYASVAGVLFNKSRTELVEYPAGNPARAYSISNGVTSIGDTAFEYGIFTNIIIPASVTNIGNYAFESCASLTGLTIPDGVTTIGYDAFAFCNGLTGINLPASVTTLGATPFSDCANMTAITVDPANPAFSGVNGVLYNRIGTVLVEFPGGLKGDYSVADGVEDIGSQAFEDCQVSAVTIPETVTNIELFGFSGCGNLGKIIVGYGLRSIGVAAFENCYSLTNIMLPESLTNIGYSAFSDCSALKTVIIPSGAIFAHYAFAYCGSLRAAIMEGKAPPDDSTVFINDSVAKVYYLQGAAGWGPTFGAAPAIQLPGITTTADPSSGEPPLTVNFAAAALDSGNKPVTNWNWTFGDGLTAYSQNPTNSYAGIGLFTALVEETNSAGDPIAAGAISISVGLPPPPPTLTGVTLNGANIKLDASNGQGGNAYIVLTSTNLAMPTSEWTPITTNILDASGNFSITVTNTFSLGLPHRFYVLQAR